MYHSYIYFMVYQISVKIKKCVICFPNSSRNMNSQHDVGVYMLKGARLSNSMWSYLNFDGLCFCFYFSEKIVFILSTKRQNLSNLLTRKKKQKKKLSLLSFV